MQNSNCSSDCQWLPDVIGSSFPSCSIPMLVTDTSFWCLVVQRLVYSCLSICGCRGRMTYVHLADMKRFISYKMEFSGKNKVGVLAESPSEMI